jgi:MFS family permease
VLISRARRLLVDVRPLRESPAFRRLWVGSVLSSVGSQMTNVAIALQVFSITHSSVAVGAVGLCAAVPAIVFGLLGGSVVDAYDRRRLVLWLTCGLAAVSGGLAAQAYAGSRQVLPLYLLVGFASLLNAVNQPARRTFIARLLPPESVAAATALNMAMFHLSMTVGPALAGVVIGVWGLRACYLIDTISFVASLYSIVRLPSMAPEGSARPGVRALVDGLRFVGRSRVLLGAFASDLNATVLGMPMALFPALNAEHFGGSPRTFGLLGSAVAVGGLLGSTLSGPLGRITRPGRVMLVAALFWGASLAGFGLVRELWLACGLLAVAGAADVASVVARSTLVQVVTPDEYRGRVNAADFVVGGACPQLGNFRAGAVASLTTPTFSAVSGGLAVVVGTAAIRLLLPSLSRFDTEVYAQPAPPRPEGADRDAAAAPA